MSNFIKTHKRSIKKYGFVLGVFLTVLFLAIITQTNVPFDPPSKYYNPTALKITNSIQIQWYAVFILTGLSLGAYLTYDEFKKVGWNPDWLFDALVIAVPLSIIGSRLYYVVFDPTPDYKNIADVIGISGGGISGLSIHGAVITAFIFVYFWTKKKKISFWVLADSLAIGFLVGQISGRWGNFMNSELYGPVIESQSFINLLPPFIRNGMFIDGLYRHPTFLYESFWNFLGLVFLLIARRKRWFKVGDVMGLYLIWYGIGRGAIIEPLRTQGAPGDPLVLFGVYINIWLSLFLFALGGVAIIVGKRYFIKNQPYYVDLLVKEENALNNEN